MFKFFIALTVVASSLSFKINNPQIARSFRLNDEQTVKDLNLEEMFEVFDQADSTVPASAIPKGFLGSEFDPKTAVGSSAPLKFFDPAGFSNDITEEQFKLYQEAEIKHGRVTMLAFLGIVVGEIAKGPLFDGAITGPAIYQFQQTYSILPYLWIVILAGITAVEGISIASFWQPLEDTLKEPLAIAKLRSTHVAGDLGFDPLGLKPKSNDALKSIRVKELNNGRLAMLAVAGIVAQELVTGQSIF